MATRKPRRSPAARKKAAKKRTARPRPKAARRPAARPAARKAPAPRRARRRDPETLRLRGFTPSFTAKSLEKSIAFYTDVLGFIVGQSWNNPAGAMVGVMLKAGACELGLTQDDGAKGRDRKLGEGVRIWCSTVQDVDALAARVKAAGFKLTEQPTDMPWGSRAFSLDDPDGYHLTIGRDLEG